LAITINRALQIRPFPPNLDIVSSIRQEMAVGFFLAWVFEAIDGENFTTQLFIVAWPTSTPRSAMISSKSRYETP
jgi:predicted O-linked N-acetylglucosamine transferase (SPINDLY family)